MDKYQLLSLMMRGADHAIDTDLYSVAALMAERLEAVSHKLDEAEIHEFIEIGAAICRYGRKEFDTGVPIEDLFPAREIWANLH